MQQDPPVTHFITEELGFILGQTPEPAATDPVPHVILEDIEEDITTRFVSDELKLTLCRLLKKYDRPEMDPQLAGMIASFGICDSYTRKCRLKMNVYCDSTKLTASVSLLKARVLFQQHDGDSTLVDGDGVPVSRVMPAGLDLSLIENPHYISCDMAGTDGIVLIMQYKSLNWSGVYMEYNQPNECIQQRHDFRRST